MMVCLLFGLSNQGKSQFAGGTGTSANPYLIANVNHLQAVRTAANNAHFRIINAIDASVTSTWNGGSGFNPIGYFNGTIDGDGFAVTGLYINRPGQGNTAFITQAGGNAEIKDIDFQSLSVTGGSYASAVIGVSDGTILNVNVSGSVSGSSYTGGIVGQLNSGAFITDCSFTGSVATSGTNTGGITGYNNSGNISDCSFQGTVNGYSGTGGIAGRNEGDITDCNVSGTITGVYEDAGGIVGWNNGGSLDNCHSNGSVNGNNYTGGLIGYSGYNGTSITNCSSASSVNGSVSTGGLIGYLNEGYIENCFSTGNVDGVSKTGGLIGFAGYGDADIEQCFATGNVYGINNETGGLIGDLQSGIVENCYAMGSVTGSNRVGGLVGQMTNGALVSYCYSTGFISYSGSQAGGLVGRRSSSTVSKSYWDKQTSGISSSSGGTGKTTSQMKTQSTFAGWNFSVIWGISSSLNGGYPYLKPISYAYVFLWTGQIDQIWEKPGNWSLNRLPILTDDVVIPITSHNPLLSSFAEVRSLTIYNGASLTVSSEGSLSVQLSLVNSGGDAGLIIESDNLSSGTLLHSSNGVHATFKRFIPGVPESWHTLSSPVTAQAIAPEFTPAGTFGDGTGYGLYHWHEPDTSWISYTFNTEWSSAHGSGNFIPGRSYLLLYQAPNPTKEFKGILNNGAVSIPLTRSPGSSDEFGYNLAGNPFPSSIDWKSSQGWNRSALEQSAGGYSIWIWNDTAGNYGVYNSASLSDAGTLGTGRYIPPTQGFFVRAAQNGNLVIPQEARVPLQPASWLRETGTDPLKLMLQVVSNTGHGSDQVMIEFGHTENQGGTEKKFGFTPNIPSLFLPVGNTPHAIRLLDDPAGYPVIPLSFRAGIHEYYSLSIQYDTSSYSYLVLEDLELNTTQNLLLNPVYKFLASPNDNENRFVIHLLPGNFANPFTSLPARLFASDHTLYADLRLLDHGAPYLLELFSLSGQTLFSTTLTGGALAALPVTQLQGICIARLSDSEKSITSKVSF